MNCTTTSGRHTECAYYYEEAQCENGTRSVPTYYEEAQCENGTRSVPTTMKRRNVLRDYERVFLNVMKHGGARRPRPTMDGNRVVGKRGYEGVNVRTAHGVCLLL